MEKYKDNPISVNTWLGFCAFLVFGAVVIGGVTRIAGAGLSIVQWQLVTGIVPPLNMQEWMQEFETYKQYPQYILTGASMTLEEFKTIYWIEYVHRLWGRLIGIIFIIPALFFLMQNKIRQRLSAVTVGFLILAQGIIGWYMVKSGLHSEPQVSHFLLAAHLSIALVIYTILLLLYFNAYYARQSLSTFFVLFVILISAATGALSAGSNGSLAYSMFPFFADKLIPEQILNTQDLGLASLYDPVIVQFLHQSLALLTIIIGFLFSIKIWRKISHAYAVIFVLLIIAQIAAGITITIMQKPPLFALIHQSISLLLIFFVVKVNAVMQHGYTHKIA